ncbi:hypothetical protein GF108_14465 [Phyllobacterium sp. SYP-B3895]|uniref:metallophosphoesterase family protein n=1 Tax=Phyllobacterium sp. SYP-B3895 TaxID=2663240 RepID=UPI001299B76D|nr:metallophosphoesterase [Phyllobacterium sp. SYP-B3895]MRG56780.1 hypothetical protein [Phyllobacterium sp. SYP-B3895]
MTTPILGVQLITLFEFAASIAIICIIFARYIKRSFKTKGEQAIYDDVLIPFQVGAWATLILIAVTYPSLDRLDAKQVAVVEFLLLIQTPLYTLLLIGRYFSGLLHRTIELIEFTIERGTSEKAVLVAHLSDAHIPEQTTIEGEIDCRQALEACSKALSWAMPRCHFLCLTGDVTDTGSETEWHHFDEMCRANAIDRERLLIVPGNHDISLETGVSPIMRNITEDFEKRCFNYIRTVIVNCPDSWEFIHNGKRFLIKKYFEKPFSDYIPSYRTYPPEVSILPAKPVSNWYLHAPKILLQYATKFGTAGFAWPTEDSPLMSDLMKILFPIVFFENENYLIVGLNSNTEGAFGVTDGAFGALGSDQLRRLKLLLGSAGTKQVLVLVHHHVGMPRRIKAKFGKKAYQLKFLQLTDARKLLRVLAPCNATIFHGHKHVAYAAKFEKTIIISAGSLCYGDIAGGRDSAAIYSMSHDGHVYLAGSNAIKADSLIPPTSFAATMTESSLRAT